MNYNMYTWIVNSDLSIIENYIYPPYVLNMYFSQTMTF